MSENGKQRVVVTVPLQHSVHIDTEFVIWNRIVPDRRFKVGLLYPRDSQAKGAAQMRNLAIKQALEVTPPADWVVFLDSDTVPQGNPLDAIADGPDADVIALLTPVWAPNLDPVDPVISNVWVSGEDGEAEQRWIDLDAAGPYVPILKAGAGCLVVRASILQDTDIRFLPALNEDVLWERSEDLGFCERAVAKGHAVALYTPLLCGHMQYVDISKVHDAVQYWKRQAVAALRRVRELEEERYAVVGG